MPSRALGRARVATSTLIMVAIVLWFWGRGLWPHELDSRRTGAGLLFLSIGVFATDGLLRLVNALLGEDAQGGMRSCVFHSRRNGQVFFPEAIPEGLKECVMLIAIGASAGFAGAMLCKATSAPQAPLPSSGVTAVARIVNVGFDLYALFLGWKFASVAPHLALSVARVCVNLTVQLFDRGFGNRLPAYQVFRASRVLSGETTPEQKVAAVASLSAIRGPVAEKALVEALERTDDRDLHARIIASLQIRGWSPSTSFQCQRLALSAPTEDPACIQVLVDSLRDSDPNIHRAAAHILDAFRWSPATSEELVAFLLAHSERPDYAGIAREGEAAIGPLFGVLDGSFPGHRDRALSALITIGSERVKQSLVERVSVGGDESLRNFIVSQLSDSRDASAAKLLVKLFEADLAQSYIDQQLLSIMESRSRKDAQFRQTVAGVISHALLNEGQPEVAQQLASILKSIDQSAWTTTCRDARRRHLPWTAPSQNALREFAEHLATLLDGNRHEDRIWAGHLIERFLNDAVEWIPSADLQKLARLEIRLVHTSQIPIYVTNNDGCDVQVGSEPRTTTHDFAPLKQLARQELLRRGESA